MKLGDYLCPGKHAEQGFINYPNRGAGALLEGEACGRPHSPHPAYRCN